MAAKQVVSNQDVPLSRQLIPRIIDRLAEITPQSLYAEYPVSPLNYDEGYRKITYGDFANAINGIAWWLHNTLGLGKDFETLAYIGPNDLRYPALILGAVKAGYLIFLTSPRNSVTAHGNLFERLRCKTILSPKPRPPPVTAILDSQKLRALEVPSVDDLLGKRYPNYPFTKTYGEAFSEPLFAVHTSGSTGMPKPLVYTHETAARNMKMMSLDPPPGFESQDKMYQGVRLFLTFPPFHGAYLVCHLFNAVQFGTVMIAPTSGNIPTAEGLVEGLKKSPADVALIVPSIVQELSQSPHLLEYCAENLKLIMYCGGDLPQAIGDTIADKIRLVNQFGASEMGMSALLQSTQGRDPHDWKYVNFHPDIGAKFHPVVDDVYELHIVRDPALEEQQPTFTIFPQIEEYASRDLFVRHPSKDKLNLWKWHARADDVIVFLNGEKTNPISMEQHIVACNPEVSAALVVGAQRFQAALLIEPVTSGDKLSLNQRADFIENIWPSIEDANRDCPAHAKIQKSHILFTPPIKPMLRAGKGTVQRAGTLQLYSHEIDDLYADADTLSSEVNGKLFDDLFRFNDNTISEVIRKSILSITSWPKLEDADDFFTLGMDSLQALTLVRKLKQGMKIPAFALSTVYTNPSIAALSDAVIRLSKEHQVSQTSEGLTLAKARSSMLSEYQDMIDQIPVPRLAVKELCDRKVVLTGSTGALGSYILNVLLTDQTIAHVYCLNRAQDGLSSQIERNKARGLFTPFDPARVTFLTADLSQRYLGLSSELYENLLDTATVVIHNAWPVNFNLSLRSFGPQLAGLVNLIDFTASAPTSPHLFFVSSISSVLSFHNASLETPEEVVFSENAPGSIGYANSKYMSELLLDYAVRKLSISSSFVRVGQIAGAVNYEGLWNKAEWFPSLVISSIHVNAIPDSLGPSLGDIDWVPIDILAKALVELAMVNESVKKSIPGPLVFHPLNPHPTTWEAIRPTFIDEISSLTSKTVRTVPLDVWLAQIRKDIEATAGSQHHLKDGELETFLKANPAAKLMEFYENALGASKGLRNKLLTKQTLANSSTLRGLEGIKSEWVRKWVREWIVVSAR